MSTFLDEMQPNFYMKFRPRIPMKQNPRAYWKYIILSVMYHIRCNKRKDLWALALSNNVVILNKIRQLKDVTSIVNYNFIDNTNDSDGNNTGNSYNDTDNDNDNDTNSYLLESYEKLSPLEQLELEVNVLRKEDDSLKTMVQSLSRQKVQLEASDFRSGDSITSTYSNSNSKTREISNSVIVEENKQIGTKKNSNGQNSSTSLAKNKVIGRISSSNSIQKLKVYTENHVEEISLQNKSSPSKSNKVLPEYNKQTSTSDSTVVNGDYRSQDEEDSIADKHSVSSTHVSRESLVNTNNRNSKSFLRSEDQRPTLSKQFSPKEKKSSKVLPAPAPSPYIRLLPDNNLSQLDEALKNIRDSKEITVDHHNVTNASDNHTVHHSVLSVSFDDTLSTIDSMGGTTARTYSTYQDEASLAPSIDTSQVSKQSNRSAKSRLSKSPKAIVPHNSVRINPQQLSESEKIATQIIYRAREKVKGENHSTSKKHLSKAEYRLLRSPYSVPLVSPEEKSSKGYTPKNPSKKHHKKERNNKVATSFTTTNMSAVIDLQLKHPNESIALKQSSGNLNSNSRVIVHDASESIQEEGNIPDGAYIPCENNKNSAADISASATVANANDNDMESSNEIAEIAISAINSNE